MTLEDVIADHTEEIQEIFHKLRTIVLNTNPEPDESFLGGAKVRMSSYSIGGKMICVIGPYKDHCKLYLHHTDHVDTGTLKLEGKGKHSKTVRISTLDEELSIEIKAVISEITKIANQS
ncbi:MAG: DUF1801 domain-containing protein [Bacteroidota bacterium]